MQLEIVTPEKKVFEGSADSVVFPGINGSFEVLDQHAPLVAALGIGPLRIKNGKEETLYQLETGVVEVLNNTVTVLAEKVISA